MLNQRIMVTAIIKKNKKYLLLKRSKYNKMYHNQWQFPEGGIKFGETPLEALKREIKEETNLELKNAKFLKHYSSVLIHFNQKLWHFLRLIYSCKVEESNISAAQIPTRKNNNINTQKLHKAPIIKLSKKHSEYKWLTTQEIKNLKLLKGFKFTDIKDIL